MQEYNIQTFEQGNCSLIATKEGVIVGSTDCTEIDRLVVSHHREKSWNFGHDGNP